MGRLTPSIDRAAAAALSRVRPLSVRRRRPITARLVGLHRPPTGHLLLLQATCSLAALSSTTAPHPPSMLLRGRHFVVCLWAAPVVIRPCRRRRPARCSHLPARVPAGGRIFYRCGADADDAARRTGRLIGERGEGCARHRRSYIPPPSPSRRLRKQSSIVHQPTFAFPARAPRPSAAGRESTGRLPRRVIDVGRAVCSASRNEKERAHGPTEPTR
uniref:Uncharacterized protein n=1 Tax=Plectus sambesii TaxID=2011161 RepID=A0A914W2F0_9BILA